MLSIQHELVIELISCDSYLPMRALTDRFKCTDRTIRKVMAGLRNLGFDIECKRNQGYRLRDPLEAQVLARKLFTGIASDRQFRVLATLTILLMSPGLVSLTDISETLFVSKTTAKADMAEATAMLGRMGITPVVNVRGHRVDLPAEERMHVLLGFLWRSDVLPQTINAIFQQVLQENRHQAVFDAVASNVASHRLEVSDADALCLVNYLLLLDHIEISGKTRELAPMTQQQLACFNDFRESVQGTLDFAPELWERSLSMYQILLLNLVPESVSTRAGQILEMFERAAEAFFNIMLLPEEQELLARVLCRWIQEHQLRMIREGSLTERVKLTYNDSFDVALQLRDILKEHGYATTEREIASLAIYLNEALVRSRSHLTAKTRILVLNPGNPMVHHHLRNSILETVDNSRFSLESMNLMIFNKAARNLPSTDTLVIGTTAKGVETSVAHGLTHVVVSPMLEGGDIDRIRQSLSAKRVESYRSRMLDMLERCKGRIIFSHREATAEEAASEHAYLVGNKVLVTLSHGEKSLLEVVCLSTPIVRVGASANTLVSFTLAPYDNLGKDLLMLKGFLVKNLQALRVDSCDTCEELLVRWGERILLTE